MKKILLIFGSEGALGSGASNILTQKDFDKVILFDFKFKEAAAKDNIEQVEIKDLSVEENVISAFKRIKPAEDTCYYLFSTIGGYHGSTEVWKTELKDIDRMININFKTNFLLGKHFADIVRNSAGGSICFTSAYVGSYAEAGKSVYGAMKAALSHLIKTFSEEGQKIRLSVNAVAPFIIDTEENRSWMKKSDYESMMKPTEIGEIVGSLFRNFNFVSGNIIELKYRFNL